MYRHHTQTLEAKRLVDEGVIGIVRFVRGSFSFPLDNPDDYRLRPEQGGGCLWDVGCYPLSFTRFLLGSEPVEVMGSQVNGPTGVDLTFTGQLVFPGRRARPDRRRLPERRAGRAGGGRQRRRPAGAPPLEAAGGPADPHHAGREDRDRVRPGAGPLPARDRGPRRSCPHRPRSRVSAWPRAGATSPRSWRCCSRRASTGRCGWSRALPSDAVPQDAAGSPLQGGARRVAAILGEAACACRWTGRMGYGSRRGSP